MAGMSDQNRLVEIERKAFRESLQDGLMEILLGAILIGMAAASINIFLVVIYLVPLIFWKPISEAARRRFTYQRIGYFRLRQDPARKVLPGVFLYQALVFVIIGIALLVAFGDFTDPSLWSQAMPVIFALMLVGAFMYTAGRTGSRRPYIYASVSILAGSLFSIMDFGDLDFRYLFGEFGAGLVLYFAFMGTLLLITGIIQFSSFMRKNPAVPDEAVTLNEAQ